MDTERSTGGAGRARSGSAASGIPGAAPQTESPGTSERESYERDRGTHESRRPGFMEQAREGALHQLDKQRERAATELTSVADAVRQSGRGLQGEHAAMASFVDTAATQIERLVGGLREKHVDDMVEDMEQFARQRPALFLGSAFCLGLVAARFLKSSSRASDAWQPYSGAREDRARRYGGFTGAPSPGPQRGAETPRSTPVPPTAPSSGT